jgi:hypothetical protein
MQASDRLPDVQADILIPYHTPLTMLFFLSTLDAAATAIGISGGVYVEQNPLMLWVLGGGIITFLFVKSMIMLGSCGCLAYAWKNKLARYVTAAGIGMYTGVLIAHSYMLSSIYI